MEERPKLHVKPNGSIRVTGKVDFIDSEGKVIDTKENFSLYKKRKSYLVEYYKMVYNFGTHFLQHCTNLQICTKCKKKMEIV